MSILKKNKLCIILSVFVCSIIFVCMLPSAVFADEKNSCCMDW